MTTIQSALGEGTETVYMQPIVYQNGGIAGYEALGRYIGTNDMVLRPDQFLPKLENAGLMAEFDRRTATCAVQQLKTWRNEGLHCFMSVNASPQALADPAYAGHVIREAFRANIPPRFITVEILENCEFYKDDACMDSLRALRSAGFQLAIDDFPTCKHPESLLLWIELQKKLPAEEQLRLHRLKLDISIARSIESTVTQLQVARYVSIAHSHKMTVVAEGVENETQLGALHKLGVDYFQGYLFGKPQPAEAAYHLASREMQQSFVARTPALMPA